MQDYHGFAEYVTSNFLDLLAINLVAKGWFELPDEDGFFICPETQKVYDVLTASLIQLMDDYSKLEDLYYENN